MTKLKDRLNILKVIDDMGKFELTDLANREKDHVQYHDGIPVHVSHWVESARKTVRGVPNNLIFYCSIRKRHL